MSNDIDQVWPGGIPHVGQIAERSRTVKAKDIERFTEISGDKNPLHYDEAWQRRAASERSSCRVA